MLPLQPQIILSLFLLLLSFDSTSSTPLRSFFEIRQNCVRLFSVEQAHRRHTHTHTAMQIVWASCNNRILLFALKATQTMTIWRTPQRFVSSETMCLFVKRQLQVWKNLYQNHLIKMHNYQTWHHVSCWWKNYSCEVSRLSQPHASVRWLFVGFGRAKKFYRFWCERTLRRAVFGFCSFIRHSGGNGAVGTIFSGG